MAVERRSFGRVGSEEHLTKVVLAEHTTTTNELKSCLQTWSRDAGDATPDVQSANQRPYT